MIKLVMMSLTEVMHTVTAVILFSILINVITRYLLTEDVALRYIHTYMIIGGKGHHQLKFSCIASCMVANKNNT